MLFCVFCFLFLFALFALFVFVFFCFVFVVYLFIFVCFRLFSSHFPLPFVSAVYESVRKHRLNVEKHLGAEKLLQGVEHMELRVGKIRVGVKEIPL